MIAIDAASSEWYQEDGTYLLPKAKKKMTKQQLTDGKELDEKFLARVGRRLSGQGFSADTVYFVVNKLRGLKR